MLDKGMFLSDGGGADITQRGDMGRRAGVMITPVRAVVWKRRNTVGAL